MKKNSTYKSAEKINISVIVPSYNQEKTIAVCLNSIVNQKTNVSYEVIVVDSSDNGAKDIAKSFAPRIKLISRNKRKSWGDARNIGIDNARGEIIAFTDTDCVVDKNWINCIYEAHKKYAVVGGSILNGNPLNFLGWTMFFSEFADFIGRKTKVVRNMAGCNVSYKKWIFKKYGKLPANQWFGAVDDFIFNHNIKEKILFSSKVRVWHINRTNFFKIIEHAHEFGYWEAVARKKTKLPGQFIINYPFLITLLPFYRFLKITYRALKSIYLPFFVLVSPLVFITLLGWTIGFYKGARTKNDNKA